LFYLSNLPAGKRVKKDDIARKLLINPSKLSMQKLVKTELVVNEGYDSRAKGYLFSWRDNVLKDKFPDLDRDYVLGEIIQFKERTV
jgi:hypothetical protein